MTLFNTLKHIVRHYLRVSLDAFPKKIPKEVQVFRNDCEKLVERYNTLLKEISEYMKDHSKPNHEDQTRKCTKPGYEREKYSIIKSKTDHPSNNTKHDHGHKWLQNTCLSKNHDAALSNFATLFSSSRLVTPAITFASPASYNVFMPSFLAVERIDSIDGLPTISSRMAESRISNS